MKKDIPFGMSFFINECRQIIVPEQINWQTKMEIPHEVIQSEFK